MPTSQTLPLAGAICYAAGDPHYLTFDKKKFDFYALGVFWLLKTKKIKIQTRLEQVFDSIIYPFTPTFQLRSSATLHTMKSCPVESRTGRKSEIYSGGPMIMSTPHTCSMPVLMAARMLTLIPAHLPMHRHMRMLGTQIDLYNASYNTLPCYFTYHAVLLS